MAIAFSYPGVYIVEASGGVPTIVGVSMSDTAFIDFFPTGPVNQATRITSFDDFQRTFGGLDERSEASFAIQQFFLNGGNVAWVIRVTASNATTAQLIVDGGSPLQETLIVNAASPGEWGNSLQIGIDWAVPAVVGSAFNLVVRQVQTVNSQVQVLKQEIYRNLSMDKTSSRYAVSVVNQGSSLVSLTDQNLGQLPTPTHTDAINNPGGGTFLALGQNGNQVGGDGYAPGSNEWYNTEGATAIVGDATAKTGMYALDRILPYIFNILCIPAAVELSPGSMQQVYSSAIAYCVDKRAFLIVDIPDGVESVTEMVNWYNTNTYLYSDHAAVYFPRLEIPDPLNEYRPRNVASSGTMAGIYARTDANRGIWKAPAGTEANLINANVARDPTGTAIKLTDLENGGLNPFGLNAIRSLPVYGNLSWGARTLNGADALASQWKYIPVRRVALYIEESLYQGSKWIVFEPNDEPLWSEIRKSFGAFMHTLFLQRAFQGQSPDQAYFVRCDSATTTQDDIDRGVVNILVGFAPLKPAEFVVITISQMAGQIAT